jgi:hypothetical protein
MWATSQSSPPARYVGISRNARGDPRFQNESGTCRESSIEAVGRLVRAFCAVGLAARSSPPRRSKVTSIDDPTPKSCGGLVAVDLATGPEGHGFGLHFAAPVGQMGFGHDPAESSKKRVCHTGAEIGLRCQPALHISCAIHVHRMSLSGNHGRLLLWVNY